MTVKQALAVLEQLNNWETGLEMTVDAWLIANDEECRARFAAQVIDEMWENAKARNERGMK